MPSATGQLQDPAPTSAPSSRAAIIAATRACLARFGVRKTTVADIARVAGVSRGTFYQHFSDKSEVLQAVAENMTEDFYLELAAVMRDGEALADQLALAAVFVSTARRRAEVEDQLLDLDVMSVVLTRHSQLLLGECVEFLIPYLDDAVRRREVRRDLDVRLAAEWFARILFSLYSTPAATFDDTSPRVVHAFVRDHCVRGFT